MSLDMTKQYRAELKALRKQRRALNTEAATLGRNCQRARAHAKRSRERACKAIDMATAKALREIDRDAQREQKRLHKTAKDIVARIAILEGRLS